MDETHWVIVGRISGLFGVRGWVRLFSYTEPRDALINYKPIYLEDTDKDTDALAWRQIHLQQGQMHGRGVIAKFREFDDRDIAAQQLNKGLAIRREQLPRLESGEYYWSDLEGLKVVTRDGVALGVVDHLFVTGANDVMVVQGERQRLIPFLQGTVVSLIDIDNSVIQVDWDPDF